MSTQAVIAFINLDNSVRYVDLVNDGDLAGDILLNHYNNYSAAQAVTSGGVISTLHPQLQDCMFHALNWGREKRETVTTVEVLFGLADIIAAASDDYYPCPVYVFDGREYHDDYVLTDHFHYHKMYGSPLANGNPNADKQYWKVLNADGTLHPIHEPENVIVLGEPGIGKTFSTK